MHLDLVILASCHCTPTRRGLGTSTGFSARCRRYMHRPRLPRQMEGLRAHQHRQGERVAGEGLTISAGTCVEHGRHSGDLVAKPAASAAAGQRKSHLLSPSLLTEAVTEQRLPLRRSGSQLYQTTQTPQLACDKGALYRCARRPGLASTVHQQSVQTNEGSNDFSPVTIPFCNTTGWYVTAVDNCRAVAVLGSCQLELN